MVFGPQHSDPDPGVLPREARVATAAAPPAPISPTPPPEVLQALDAAARVLEELASKRIRLHFAYDGHADAVRVQVLRADGTLVREIPPSVLVDIASGAQSDGHVTPVLLADLAAR